MKKRNILKKFVSLLLTSMICCSMLTGCLDDDFWEEDYETEESEEDSYDDGSFEGDVSADSGSSSENNITSTQNVSFEDVAIRDHKVKLKGNSEDTVTILMYVNGSNLESEDNQATKDFTEAIAGAGDSDKVNILVQTMGTKEWASKYSIASNRTQRYKLDGNGMNLVDDSMGQLDCTDATTFRDFLVWGAQNYPADRYILLFWDHGGGPVYGFGFDEWQEEDAALTIDEMQVAMKDAGVYFDFIGMDCCIMSSIEVCMALYDYCDYAILSEDFESGLGWAYKDWIKALYNNTSIPTPELGKMICDDMVNANASDSEGGDKSIMALIDQSMMKVLYTAWRDFAYANEADLLATNYSRQVTRSSRAIPTGKRSPSSKTSDKDLISWDGLFSDGWNYFFGEDENSLADYYITDVMAVSSTIDTDESKALNAALNDTLIYVAATEEDAGLTGISVTLPYGDASFYRNLKEIFTNVGIEEDYVTWLGKFTSAQGTSDFYSYDDWDEDWSGWDDYDDDYDWSDWDYYADDSYWTDDSCWGFDDWSYEDSWNEWLFEDDDSWFWDEDDDFWYYEGDDWYYEDDDWDYEDDDEFWF